jgi:hypothetical protein
MIALTRASLRALKSVFSAHTLWAGVLPSLVAVLGWSALLWFGWHGLVAGTGDVLDTLGIDGVLHQLFAAVHLTMLDAVVAPLLVVMLMTPLMVVSVVVLTAVLAPVFVNAFFAKQRYAHLEAMQGGTWFGSLRLALGSLLVALALLVVSMPLWLIPPLVVILPAVIWGWLTARILTYDMLAYHASEAERRQIMRENRWSLLLMGIACTMLGALPTAIWVFSFWTLALFPLIAAVMLWVYALVMVFSALWFGYFCLEALERLRARTDVTYREPSLSP